jgi:alanine-synthesizing transaminase
VFSSRLPGDFHPNRLTLALEAKRREGAKILDLTQSNPTQAGLAYPPQILCAFQDERLLQYEPNPAGLYEARTAVSRYYEARGLRVEPERILLTCSTSEAYSYLFKLLTEPGDHVLAPRPSYPLFEPLADLESIAVRPYSLSYDGRWVIDTGAIESALTGRTRAIILVNPNNPTGSYVKRPELECLLRISEERQIALISDEVFADYSFGPDAGRAPNLAGVQTGLAFALSGLSKIAGLPQMKLGWIVAAGAADLVQGAFQRLEWIADTYLSAGTPVQCAASRLLEAGEAIQLQIRGRTLANLRLLQRQMAGSAATVFAVEGGWYAIVQVPRVRTEEDWAVDLLNRCNVLVQPGFFYDFESEAFLVASLLTHPDIFREGLERFRHFIGS